MRVRPAKFRKRPVTIEAVRILHPDQLEAAAEWCGGWETSLLRWDPNLGGYCIPFPRRIYYCVRFDGVIIPTLEGDMAARLGDHIVRGVAGEFYPVEHTIFVRTYERVEA